MITCIRKHCCNIAMALMRFFFSCNINMLRLGWVSFVFLSLNLHHLCVVVTRRKISSTALFSQLYHTDCYERDKYDFAFLREILDFLKYFNLI